ncbi:MAG TPA: hypothetical protein VGN15_09820, partial [Ktedonobacteraceae bacterium]|nr:hypothetical protein [Ktedonobacteraceae bacterium]
FEHRGDVEEGTLCPIQVTEWHKQATVGAGLPCPSPIDRPPGRADQSAMVAINRPLQTVHTSIPAKQLIAVAVQ